MRTFGMIVLVLGGIAGCGEMSLTAAKKVVAPESVPDVVMKAAKARLPDVTFDTVIRADGYYEVRGKYKDGKVVEVELNEAGEVLQVE